MSARTAPRALELRPLAYELCCGAVTVWLVIKLLPFPLFLALSPGFLVCDIVKRLKLFQFASE